MTPLPATDSSSYHQETRRQLLLRLIPGASPGRQRAGHMNPQWDPAGLWSFHENGADTSGPDALDEATKQEKFI